MNLLVIFMLNIIFVEGSKLVTTQPTTEFQQSNMKRKLDIVDKAELAARTTVKEWIRQTLRESFLQALRQAWNIRNQASTTNENKTQIALSLSGVYACFSFVEKVSRAWQSKLREEKHERVARWIEEVFREGQSSLWEAPLGKDDEESDLEYSETAMDNKHASLSSQQETQSLSDCSSEDDGDRKDNDNETVGVDAGDETSQDDSASDHDHRNVYCKLRSLGRRKTLDSPVLSVPDALKELKDFAQNHSTYWPLSDNIIDQACSDLSRRMLARDKHGSTVSSNASARKSVRFKVLPKSVWETKQQQERNDIESTQIVEQNAVQTASSMQPQFDQESGLESVLASIKNRKSNTQSISTYQKVQKKTRSSAEQEESRPPFDPPLDSDGKLVMDLSLDDKKVVEDLLIIDDDSQDANGSQAGTATKPELPLALFGGLKHVGQVNHFLQNPSAKSIPFMAKGTDRVTRRKQKQSLQERLDPNRLQAGRAEEPVNQRSKILRTENWFEDQMKFMELDLGWCLMEIQTEGRQKRLCAFSSMEICLDDNGSPGIN